MTDKTPQYPGRGGGLDGVGDQAIKAARHITKGYIMEHGVAELDSKKLETAMQIALDPKTAAKILEVGEEALYEKLMQRYAGYGHGRNGELKAMREASIRDNIRKIKEIANGPSCKISSLLRATRECFADAFKRG